MAWVLERGRSCAMVENNVRIAADEGEYKYLFSREFGYAIFLRDLSEL